MFECDCGNIVKSIWESQKEVGVNCRECGREVVINKATMMQEYINSNKDIPIKWKPKYQKVTVEISGKSNQITHN